MKRSILIVSASMGAGHDGAARELARRLEANGYTTETVDFIKLMPFGSGPILRRTYELQLRFCAWTYELSYQALSRATPLVWRSVVAFVSFLARRSLRRRILATRPDAIVSTYPLASLVLGRLRRKQHLRVPVATYLTDFAVHPLWVHPGVDVHLAVSPRSSEEASRRGASTSFASGPLVDDRFRAARASREETRVRLGVEDDARVVLVVAGSLGLGDLPDVVESIHRCGEFHTVVVCGSNERLRTSLATRQIGDTVLGWTDQMPELMAAADALVENAGGLTAMEAFSAGLPVITYRPIAGHGRANARSMESGAVNRYARDEDELRVALEHATNPGPARDALVAAGSDLFAGDPARHVMDLASTTGSDALVAPLRRGRRGRVVVGVTALLFVAIALTEGAEAIAGFGVGVAKPPRGAHHATYLGIRMTSAELDNARVIAASDRLGASIVVDATTARRSGNELAAIAAGGTDIANAGSGRSSALPWDQARADCRAAATISARAASPTREFVTQEGPDVFDQLFCRLGHPHQRLVRPDRTIRPASLPSAVDPGEIYLLDGRGSDPNSLAAALDDLGREASAADLQVRPLATLR